MSFRHLELPRGWGLPRPSARSETRGQADNETARRQKSPFSNTLPCRCRLGKLVYYFEMAAVRPLVAVQGLDGSTVGQASKFRRLHSPAINKIDPLFVALTHYLYGFYLMCCRSNCPPFSLHRFGATSCKLCTLA
jgi:hypothetical protein